MRCNSLTSIDDNDPHHILRVDIVMIAPRNIFAWQRYASVLKQRLSYTARRNPDEYLQRQLNFFATEFVDCRFLRYMERYEEQEEHFYKSIITASCEVAATVFRPIKVQCNLSTSDND
jgi:hypothetical protein